MGLCVFIQLMRSEFIEMSNGVILAIVPTFLILMGSLVLGIGMQTVQPLVKRFKLPLNPLLPALNIFTCIYLLTCFGPMNWIRFTVWVVLGE